MKRVKQVLALQEQSWPSRRTGGRARPNKLVQRLDEVTLAQLVAAYESGATGRQLSLQFGLARSSVIALLRARGVAIRNPRVTPVEVAEVVGMFQAGLSQVEIARRIGRNPGLV